MTPDEKLDTILLKLGSVETKVEVSIAHQKQHRIELNDHKKHIEDLKRTRDEEVGKKALLSTASAFLGGIIGSAFTYFTHK